MRKTILTTALSLLCLTLNAQDFISVNEALAILLSNNYKVAEEILKSEGYQYEKSSYEFEIEIAEGRYWTKNCNVAIDGEDIEAINFQNGTSSLVALYFSSDEILISVISYVYNQKNKQIWEEQLSQLGYERNQYGRFEKNDHCIDLYSFGNVYRLQVYNYSF